jgi:hypothetical protein
MRFIENDQPFAECVTVVIKNASMPQRRIMAKTVGWEKGISFKLPKIHTEYEMSAIPKILERI